MSNLEAWIIVILVLGVIVSNLAALRYSAKFKLPQFGQQDQRKVLMQDKVLKQDEETPAASPQPSAPPATPTDAAAAPSCPKGSATIMKSETAAQPNLSQSQSQTHTSTETSTQSSTDTSTNPSPK